MWTEKRPVRQAVAAVGHSYMHLQIQLPVSQTVLVFAFPPFIVNSFGYWQFLKTGRRNRHEKVTIRIKGYNI